MTQQVSGMRQSPGRCAMVTESNQGSYATMGYDLDKNMRDPHGTMPPQQTARNIMGALAHEFRASMRAQMRGAGISGAK